MWVVVIFFRKMLLVKHIGFLVKMFQVYWISWVSPMISVGRGLDVGTNMFMSKTFTILNPINYIAISTGWGVTGKWIYNLGKI